MIRLELDINEVNGVLKVLNELPTSSGAWPLVQKIQGQAEAQLKEQQTQQQLGE